MESDFLLSLRGASGRAWRFLRTACVDLRFLVDACLEPVAEGFVGHEEIDFFWLEVEAALPDQIGFDALQPRRPEGDELCAAPPGPGRPLHPNRV